MAADLIYDALYRIGGAELHISQLADRTGLTRYQVRNGWQVLRTQRRNDRMAILIERGRYSGYSLVDDHQTAQLDVLQNAKHILTRLYTEETVTEEWERMLERVGMGHLRPLATSATMGTVRAQEAVKGFMTAIGSSLGMDRDQIEEMLAPRR
jgi:hypothetical protein